MQTGNLKNVLFKCIFIMLGGTLAGGLLLVGVYMLPVAPMKENAKDAVEIFEKEGSQYCLIEGLDMTTLDTYSDAVMLNIATYPRSGNILFETMAANRSGYKDKTSFGSFLQFMAEDISYEAMPYARYWHGYLVALKPLLLLFSYGEIRLINCIGVLALLCLVIAEMVKKKMEDYLVAFMMGILFLFPATIMLTMEYAGNYYVTMFAILVLLKKYEWLYQKNLFYGLYLVVGMAVCFVDLLTYPIVSLGFVLLMHLALAGKKIENIKEVLVFVFTNSFFWLCGYFGFWSMKWVCASLIMKENVIKEAILVVLYRASNEFSDSGDTQMITRWDGLVRNFKIFDGKLFVFIVLGLGIWIAYRCIKLKKICVNRYFFLCAIIIAMMPFVWYIVINNHSYVHYWMTYKGMAVSAFAVGMAGVSLTDK